ncbi:MAG: glycosyl transferase family 1, partial [Acidobacteria bacterium]
MNILFLTAYAPVLHMHGGGVRMYHNIRILSEQHSVRVISFV